MKEQWQEFRRAPPGQRFQGRYQDHRIKRASQSPFMRPLKPMAALLLLVAGVLLCLIPGPGIPLILIGAGLLADDSLAVARAMDGLELRLRKIITWACDLWRRTSKADKHALLAAVVFVICGAAYGGYRFFTSR